MPFVVYLLYFTWDYSSAFTIVCSEGQYFGRHTELPERETSDPLVAAPYRTTRLTRIWLMINRGNDVPVVVSRLEGRHKYRRMAAEIDHAPDPSKTQATVGGATKPTVPFVVYLVYMGLFLGVRLFS